MHKHVKMPLTTLLAIVACLLVAGSAGANRSIEIRGGESGSLISRLKFIGTEGSAALEIQCSTTFLHQRKRIIEKRAGITYDHIIGEAINRGGTTRSPNCSHGSFIREVHDITPLPTTHRELGGNVLLFTVNGSFRVIYDSFAGSLPRIEGINFHIERYAFNLALLEPFGGTIECLYEGSVFGLFEVVRETGVLSRGRFVRERTSLTRIRGSGICPARGSFEGSFTVSPTLTIALL